MSDICILAHLTSDGRRQRDFSSTVWGYRNYRALFLKICSVEPYSFVKFRKRDFKVNVYIVNMPRSFLPWLFPLPLFCFLKFSHLRTL